MMFSLNRGFGVMIILGAALASASLFGQQPTGSIPWQGTPPAPAAPAAPAAPPAPPKVDKHFSVPVHEHATETLIKKSTARPLDVVANDGDKTMRIRTIRRTDCQEVNKDRFDETVSAFLEKVGQANIVSINAVNYSYMELSTRHILTDYGVMVIFKG